MISLSRLHGEWPSTLHGARPIIKLLSVFVFISLSLCSVLNVHECMRVSICVRFLYGVCECLISLMHAVNHLPTHTYGFLLKNKTVHTDFQHIGAHIFLKKDKGRWFTCNGQISP